MILSRMQKGRLRHRGRPRVAKRGSGALHTKASDWSVGVEVQRHNGWSLGFNLGYWPSSPGTLFSQNLVLAPAQACDSAAVHKAFLTPPATQPSSGTSPPLATPRRIHPWPPKTSHAHLLAFLLLCLPTLTTPAWQLPFRLPSPTSTPSFLASEYGIEKASG